MRKKVRRALTGSLLVIGGLGLGRLFGGALVLGMSSLGGCEDDPNERFFYAKQVTDKFNELAATALHHAAQRDDLEGGGFAQLPVMQRALSSPSSSMGSESSAGPESLLGFGRQHLGGRLLFNLRRPERGDWDFIYDIKPRGSDQDGESKSTTPGSITGEVSAPVQRLTQEDAIVPSPQSIADNLPEWDEYWDRLQGLGLEGRVGFQWQNGSPHEKRWYDDPHIEAMLGLRRKGEEGPFTPVLWARAQNGRLELESLRADFPEATGPLWAAILKLKTNSVRFNDSSLNFAAADIPEAMEMEDGSPPKNHLRVTIRFPDKDGNSACPRGQDTCVAFESDNVPHDILAVLETKNPVYRKMARLHEAKEEALAGKQKKEQELTAEQKAHGETLDELDGAKNKLSDAEAELNKKKAAITAQARTIATQGAKLKAHAAATQAARDRADQVRNDLKQALADAESAVKNVRWVRHVVNQGQDAVVLNGVARDWDAILPSLAVVAAFELAHETAYKNFKKVYSASGFPELRCRNGRDRLLKGVEPLQKDEKACFQARLAEVAARAGNWPLAEKLLSSRVPIILPKPRWPDVPADSAGNGGAINYVEAVLAGPGIAPGKFRVNKAQQNILWSGVKASLENALAAVRVAKKVSRAHLQVETVQRYLNDAKNAANTAKWAAADRVDNVHGGLGDVVGPLRAARELIQGARTHAQNLANTPALAAAWNPVVAALQQLHTNLQNAERHVQRLKISLENVLGLQSRKQAADVLTAATSVQQAKAAEAANHANQALTAARRSNWGQVAAELQSALAAARQAVP